MRVLFITLVFITSNGLASTNKKYSIDIFCQDMNVVLQRMSVHSFNIANHETTRTVKGGAFKRKKISSCSNGYCKTTLDVSPPTMKYQPDHPDTNKSGYVAYPSFSILEEKVFLARAAQVYEVIVEKLSCWFYRLLGGK